MKNEKDIMSYFKNVKRESLSEHEKKVLWAKISNEIDGMSRAKAHGALAPKAGFSGLFTRAVALLLAVAVLIGGSAGAYASVDGAKPGDRLFPLDLALEKVHIALAFGTKKDKVRIAVAKERLSEAMQILSALSEGMEDGQSTDTENTKTVDNMSVATDSMGASATESILFATDSAEIASGDVATESNPEHGDGVIEEDATSERFAVANSVLAFALAQIEAAKAKLAARGNAEGVTAVDGVIGQLSALAKTHLAAFDTFEAKISKKGKSVKTEIKVQTEEVKTKFVLWQKESESRGNAEAKVMANDNKIKIFSKEDGITLEITQREKEKKDEDKNGGSVRVSKQEKEESDDDEDDDDEDGNDDGKNRKEKEKGEHARGTGNDKAVVCHKGHEIVVSVSSLGGHLGHGDTTGRCGENVRDNDNNEDNDDDVSPADTASPTISNISFSVSTSSAIVLWSTDELSDGRVWYAASPSIATGSATPSVFSTALAVNHSFSLTGLSAGTKYYIVVSSKDAAGNVSVSDEKSFTMAQNSPLPDTTAPVISEISSTAIASTSATITWITNEEAHSLLWYSASPLVDTAATASVAHTASVTAHSISLSGLSAGTTYYYVVGSTDATGNLAKSEEESFATVVE